MKFVIFHGSFGDPSQHWMPWLNQELTRLGHDVLQPAFPIDDWDEIHNIGQEKAQTKKQTLENWLKVYQEQVKDFADTETIFVGHSLGPVFSLHALERFPQKIHSAFFLAPFFQKLELDLWEINVANKTFYSDDIDFKTLHDLIPRSTVIYGDNDPYVKTKFTMAFAEKMGSSLVEVKDGNHLGSSMGQTFPLLLDLITRDI